METRNESVLTELVREGRLEREAARGLVPTPIHLLPLRSQVRCCQKRGKFFVCRDDVEDEVTHVGEHFELPAHTRKLGGSNCF